MTPSVIVWDLETVPDLGGFAAATVAYLVNSPNPNAALELKEAQIAARVLTIPLRVLDANTEEGLVAAVEDLIACNHIPYATEQGISKRVSGIFFPRTGKFDRATANPLNGSLTSCRAWLRPEPIQPSKGLAFNRSRNGQRLV